MNPEQSPPRSQILSQFSPGDDGPPTGCHAVKRPREEDDESDASELDARELSFNGDDALMEEKDANHCETVRKPRGRPAKKTRRTEELPEVDPRFKGKGFLTPEAKGFLIGMLPRHMDDGRSISWMAARYAVSRQTIHNILEAELGSATMRDLGCDPSRFVTDEVMARQAIRAAALMELLNKDEHWDKSVRELAGAFEVEYGEEISHSTVWRDLNELAMARHRDRAPFVGAKGLEDWAKVRLKFAKRMLRWPEMAQFLASSAKKKRQLGELVVQFLRSHKQTPDEFVEKLCWSFTRRLERCVQREGKLTGY